AARSESRRSWTPMPMAWRLMVTRISRPCLGARICRSRNGCWRRRPSGSQEKSKMADNRPLNSEPAEAEIEAAQKMREYRQKHGRRPSYVEKPAPQALQERSPGGLTREERLRLGQEMDAKIAAARVAGTLGVHRASF